MIKFTLDNSTRIHFGQGQVAQLANEISGDHKVLFLYGGGSIKRNGIYDQVMTHIGHVQPMEFAGVQPNPKYEHLLDAVAVCKQQKINLILAVGGGSVIDAAKFIAAAACYEGEPWDLFTGKARVENSLDIGSLLTLPATGSESNGGTVITRGRDKLSLVDDKLRPKFAILDPSFSLSLPAKQVANGVIDAFVHVLEQYVTQELETKHPIANKVQDRFAEGLLITLIEEGMVAKNHPQDINARTNIMWAANQALNGLIGAGVQHDWSTHLIGHELTALYDIDHACTLSIILPAVWKARKSEKSIKLIQYAERVWGVNDCTIDEKLDAAIHKTEEFFVEMGLPIRLSDVGLGENIVDEVVAQLHEHGMTALGEDRSIDLEKSREILRLALH